MNCFFIGQAIFYLFLKNFHANMLHDYFGETGIWGLLNLNELKNHMMEPIIM